VRHDGEPNLRFCRRIGIERVEAQPRFANHPGRINRIEAEQLVEHHAAQAELPQDAGVMSVFVMSPTSTVPVARSVAAASRAAARSAS
jgi:hypothetical protein